METEQDSRVVQLERPNPDTEKLIYEHIKDAPRQQREIANWQDDKMLRIFGAASIVIGFLGLSSSSSLRQSFGLESLFLVLPLIPYVFTAVVAFRHLNPSLFHAALRADELPTHWQETEGAVRRGLIGDIGEAYSENRPILEQKARYIRCALVATSVEVGLVVVALILYHL